MYTTRRVPLSGFQALSSRRQVLAHTYIENSQKQLSRHQVHMRLCIAVAETQITSDYQGDNLDEMEDIFPLSFHHHHHHHIDLNASDVPHSDIFKGEGSSCNMIGYNSGNDN